MSQQPESPRADAEPLIPIEQLPVTLLDLAVLAVRRDDGRIYLSVRDLCDALGLSSASQLRRIRAHARLAVGLERFRIATAGGPQEQLLLLLERVPTWLLMIDVARVSEDTRPRLTFLQDYLIQEVYAAFARLGRLPDGPSNRIEDIADLRRIDHALSMLTERQERIEESQEKARAVWRDLHTQLRDIAGRLQELEQRVEGTISKAQRGYIYQLVQLWGEARFAHTPGLTRSAAFASCWAALKARYRLASYEDLPTAKYADCVAFIKQQYRNLTGVDLALPEQEELDL